MVYFWPISSFFGAKKVFPKKSSSVMHNLIMVSSTMPKFREIQWSNVKKTPRQTTGWKDGQTLFHRILPATARGLASTTAVDWHLKVKDKEYNVGLTKNYCITVSMQKISSIHTLVLKIQQIWGSYELNKWAHPFFTTPSTANKYYFSVGHHEQKNKKSTSQIKFSAVTIRQWTKLVLDILFVNKY